MVDLILKYLNNLFGGGNKRPSLEDEVLYSIKKYKNTYRLLEEYDKKSKKETTILDDPEGLRDYFQPLD